MANRGYDTYDPFHTNVREERGRNIRDLDEEIMNHVQRLNHQDNADWGPYHRAVAMRNRLIEQQPADFDDIYNTLQQQPADFDDIYNTSHTNVREERGRNIRNLEEEMINHVQHLSVEDHADWDPYYTAVAMRNSLIEEEQRDFDIENGERDDDSSHHEEISYLAQMHADEMQENENDARRYRNEPSSDVPTRATSTARVGTGPANAAFNRELADARRRHHTDPHRKAVVKQNRQQSRINDNGPASGIRHGGSLHGNTYETPQREIPNTHVSSATHEDMRNTMRDVAMNRRHASLKHFHRADPVRLAAMNDRRENAIELRRNAVEEQNEERHSAQEIRVNDRRQNAIELRRNAVKEQNEERHSAQEIRVNDRSKNANELRLNSVEKLNEERRSAQEIRASAAEARIAALLNESNRMAASRLEDASRLEVASRFEGHLAASRADRARTGWDDWHARHPYPK
jgi:hypothetical protein